MTLKSKIIVAYLLALLASHVWVAMRETDAAESRREALPRGGVGELWVLVGGVGGSSGELDELARLLKRDGRADAWVAPVADGFDAETALVGLLESDYERINVLGSGYGSIDATFLAESLGERAGRVALVSPALSTRFELLGDERLNRAMKAFQLAWFWALEQAVPHFGYSRELPYNYVVARRIFGADQDRASTAYAGSRAETLLFWKQGAGAESGAAEAYQAVRPDARAFAYGTAVDLAEALTGDFDFASSSSESNEPKRFEDFRGVKLGPWAAAFLLGVSTLASEDLACIGGGLLAASGAIGLAPAIVGCWMGIFFGDLGIYFIGRVFGATALQMPVLRRLVSGKALNRSADWFAKRGIGLVVLTRFFPGSRVPTYFAAGVVKANWIRFAFALLIASAIWTPILVVASYYLGERFLAFFESLGTSSWLGIVAFLVVFGLGARVLAKLATWKGRRLLYGSWRRATSWEFWPMWAVYAPVIGQILWLAIRYRSISLPFSVNPCMPASGLVYESKIQILSHLAKAGVPIARFEAIALELSAAEKLERLREFMARLDLSYPVVLKPDVGQRGQGVAIARSEEQAAAFFANQAEDTIAQEFIDGAEYGVFYQRFANRERGVVSSVTDKRTTWVVGDGASSLEQLILGDERAVCMSRYFLSEYEAELEEVPEKDAIFMLASIGTHSRGAVFLDGADLITPELEAEVDRFSKVVDGFHFGRYDLRVPSEEALKRGEGIRVIELNGITSEPTHMYDPKHGPLFGWTCLMRQWRAIFALAKENRLAGHEPVSKRYLLKLAIGHFRGVASRDLS